RVQTLALSPDERLTLAGTELGQVSLHEVPSGRVVLELSAHRRAVTGVAFAGPDLLVTASLDGEAKLWRRAGEHRLALPAPGPVQRLAISPDATRLALAIQNERAVRLWRLDELAQRLARLGLPLERVEPPTPQAFPLSPPPDIPPASPQGLKAELFTRANFNVQIREPTD